MIIYAVETRGEITHNDWSIVTIWNNKEQAEKAKVHYVQNCSNNEIDLEYRIKKLDTDNNCIYDFEE